MVELRTDRLVLRHWTAGDFAPFADLNADPEVMEHFPAPMARVASDDSAARISAHLDEHGWGLWAVEPADGPDTGRFAGFTGLAVPSWPAPFGPCVETGWRLARWAWGRGYATEAARAALAYGFGPLRLAEVVSFTAVSNVRSQAVMVRLGMHTDPAEDFDHPRIAPDSPVRRHVLYRLGRAAFDPGHPPATV